MAKILSDFSSHVGFSSDLSSENFIFHFQFVIKLIRILFKQNLIGFAGV